MQKYGSRTASEILRTALALKTIVGHDNALGSTKQKNYNFKESWCTEKCSRESVRLLKFVTYLFAIGPILFFPIHDSSQIRGDCLSASEVR